MLTLALALLLAAPVAAGDTDLDCISLGPQIYRPKPITTLRADECRPETLHVALLAVAGVRTGLVQIDPPAVSLLDSGADHERAVRERNDRVRQLVSLVLQACAKEAQKAEKEPAK